MHRQSTGTMQKNASLSLAGMTTLRKGWAQKDEKRVFSSHLKNTSKLIFAALDGSFSLLLPSWNYPIFQDYLESFFKLIKIAFRCLRGRQRNHQTLEKSHLVFFLFQLQKVNWKSPSIEYSLSTSRPSARIWNWISLYLIRVKFSKGFRSFW